MTTGVENVLAVTTGICLGVTVALCLWRIHLFMRAIEAALKTWTKYKTRRIGYHDD